MPPKRPPVRCASCAAALAASAPRGVVTFCEDCQARVEALQKSEGLHWFVAHVDGSYIVGSSHPHVVPNSPPPLPPLDDAAADAAPLEARVLAAARAVRGAARLLVVAGAGMSVDSGLPAFRGEGGFYNFGGAQIAMSDVDLHPSRGKLKVAWAYLSSMLEAFETHEPHVGYAVVVEQLLARVTDGFVFTSNIDGYFRRAGLDDERLYESHGSFDLLQCTSYGTEHACRATVWPREPGEARPSLSRRAADDALVADLAGVPRCAECGAYARPNISHVTDEDDDVCPERKAPARERLERFLRRADLAAARRRGRRAAPGLVILEIGAGTSAHSLRVDSELVARRCGATIVRIDPDGAPVPRGGHVSLKLPGLEALTRLAAAIEELDAAARAERGATSQKRPLAPSDSYGE